MKRVAAGIALFILLLFPALAAASHGTGPGGTRDFAVGGGTTGDQAEPTSEQHVDFAASGGPTPFAPVTGNFRAGGEFDQFNLSEFQQEGPVTCLVVEQPSEGTTRARLVYPVKQASGENETLLEASEVLIFLEDNGPPENGQPVDRIGFVPLTDETPDDPPSEQDPECVTPLVTPTPVQLEKGNFTIHKGP